MPSLSGACEPGSGSYYSDRQFLSAVDFEALGVDFDPELEPQSMHVADITGDGFEDFIVGPELDVACNRPAYPIRVLVNNGSGSLVDQTDTRFATPVRPMGMVRQYFVEDFNDDGFPDLYLDTTGQECGFPFPGEQNVLYLSDGLGQLHDATINLPQESDFSHGSTVGDFSGDGIPDIYVNNLGREGVVSSRPPYNLLLNDGAGKFTVVNERLEHLCDGDPCSDWWAPFWSQFIDANDDGFLDLFLNTGEIFPQGDSFPLNPAKLALNDGTGHFGDPVESAIPPRLFGDKSVSNQSLVADLNGDGLDDLIVDENEAQIERTVIRIFINNGDGTFSDETVQRLPGQVTESGSVGHISARDYNGDGAVDLLGHIDFINHILINDGSGVMRELPQDEPCIDLWWEPIDIDGDNGVDFIHMQNINNKGPWYYLVKSLRAYGPDFSGAASNDRFVGGRGTNVMDGGEGNDELLGGDGDDLLIGGPGDDTLIGENGDDRYTYSLGDLANKDIISDKQGIDQLVFTDFDLTQVLSAEQDADGALLIHLVAGGHILVEGQFLGTGFGIDRLVVGGTVYLVSNDPAFSDGSFDILLQLAPLLEQSRPTGIRATDGSFPTRVRVTFNTVPGATVYRVFRCLDAGPDCGNPIGYPRTGVFNDFKGNLEQVYYYRVRACTKIVCGKFSVANTGFTSPAPDRPTGIRATDGTFTDRVRVTFNPVNGAFVYRVFRCLNTGPNCGNPIGFPRTESFNDSKGDPDTVYYYRVRACTVRTCGLFSVANTGHR